MIHRSREPVAEIVLTRTSDRFQEGQCLFCKDDDGEPGLVFPVVNPTTMEYTGWASCALCGQRYTLDESQTQSR